MFGIRIFELSKIRVMSTKLTLTVDKNIIEEAKKYAKANGRSLSNIIEEYLKALVSQESEKEEDFEISPLVKSLWGSVQTPSDKQKDKDLLTDALMQKYL